LFEENSLGMISPRSQEQLTMRRSILFLGLLAAVACVVPAAQASIVYQYVAVDQIGNSGLQSTGTNSGTIQFSAAGGKYTLDIYLQETVTGGDTSLIVGGQGLKGAGWSFNRKTGDGLASFFGNPSDPNNGSGPPNDFGGSGTLRTPTNITGGTGVANGRMTEGYSVTQATGVTGQDMGGGVRKILLGSVQFTYQGADSSFALTAFSTVSNGTTTLFNTSAYGGKTVGIDADNNSGNTGYTGPTFLGAKDGTYTLLLTTGTSVPEPSSMILGGFAIFGGGLGYMRRRFAKKQA